jgi:hypothetical protein
MPYKAPYETLYEALYKTSDHGSSPPARHSARSLREDSEYSSGEVEPVRMACMVVYHHNIEGSEDEEWRYDFERFECPRPTMCGSPDVQHWRPFPEGEDFIQEDDDEEDGEYTNDDDEDGEEASHTDDNEDHSEYADDDEDHSEYTDDDDEDHSEYADDDDEDHSKYADDDDENGNYTDNDDGYD